MGFSLLTQQIPSHVNLVVPPLHRDYPEEVGHASDYVINPRRACAARVTVLGLCVCLCVCVSTLISALRGTKWMMSDTNGFCITSARKIKWRFSYNGRVLA